MATRTQAREVVISLLYAFNVGNTEIEKFASEILEERQIRNRQKEFAINLFHGTLTHLDEIDTIIKSLLKDWDFDRLGDMEKAILRLGVFEILYSDTDRAVVINEAVELSKHFASDNSPRFINGVLDALKPAPNSHKKGDS